MGKILKYKIRCLKYIPKMGMDVQEQTDRLTAAHLPLSCFPISVPL